MLLVGPIYQHSITSHTISQSYLETRASSSSHRAAPVLLLLPNSSPSSLLLLAPTGLLHTARPCAAQVQPLPAPPACTPAPPHSSCSPPVGRAPPGLAPTCARPPRGRRCAEAPPRSSWLFFAPNQSARRLPHRPAVCRQALCRPKRIDNGLLWPNTYRP
jgi:hypothetical protein